MTKITNSIGTVNYLHKITKDKNGNLKTNTSSETINCLTDDNMVLDVSTKFLAMPTAHIIISTAIADLRDTLFYYPLVFI